MPHSAQNPSTPSEPHEKNGEKALKQMSTMCLPRVSPGLFLRALMIDVISIQKRLGTSPTTAYNLRLFPTTSNSRSIGHVPKILSHAIRQVY